jgi:hypothetical protein
VPEADFASFASTFVRLAAGITKADVGITAPDASGCGSGHHTLLAGVCLMTPIPTASFASATSPSAIWIETSDAQCDELHCWRFFFPTRWTKRSQIGSRHPAKVSLFLVGAKQRGHKGRQSQAPKQVLGVVTLHAICEE